MTHLLPDIRFALRTFAKSPGFTALAVLVLALGIGANSAIFSIVNGVLFRPLSGQAGDLVGLYSHDHTRPDSYRAFSYPNYADIRAEQGLFAGLLAHTMTSAGVTEGDRTRRTFVALTSSNYFEALGVRLAAGRTFTAEEERPGADQRVVITGYGAWQAHGLDPAFLGSTIRINAQDFIVVGVAPRGFTGTMALAAPDMWLPLGVFESVARDRNKTSGAGLADRANPTLILAGRLQPGVDQAVVQERLDLLSRQLEEAYPAENRNQRLTTHPLSRMATSTTPQSDAAMVPIAGILMALSSVVLLIACLNIANMLLARGASRRREVAVRLALGAARGRIVRQLLTEGILLSLVSAAAGLVLAYWTMRVLVTSMAAILPLTLTLDPRPDTNVILATTIFAVASTLLFGLGPALKLSRRDLVADLKETLQDATGLRRRLSGRNALVVGQIALSLALLTAGGLFAGAALRAGQSNPGFDYERGLLVSFDAAMAGQTEVEHRESYGRVLRRMRELPGVEAAGLASTVPFGDTREGRQVERLGGEPGEARSADYRVISSDYFRALGLSVLQGREFTAAEDVDADAPAVAMIDDLLAERLFPGRSPIGESIRFPATPGAGTARPDVVFEVVAVAPRLSEDIIETSPRPHVYVPAGRYGQAAMHVHVRTSPGVDSAAALSALRNELRASVPDLPVLEITTMQAFHDRSLQLWVLNAGGTMFLVLGLLALGLAVVGVYGVKSYVVANRTREIGIRMALGARRADVVWMVLRDAMALTAAGVALGLPLAVGVAFVLRSIFANLTSFDPLVFAGAPAVLALAAIAAAYVPARRATRITPLSALRSQ